jgi:hypothetical protein
LYHYVSLSTLKFSIGFLAVLILIGIRHEKIHYITWLCELLALLSLVLGDSWFAIIALKEVVE